MNLLNTIQKEVALEPFNPEINITPEGENIKSRK